MVSSLWRFARPAIVALIQAATISISLRSVSMPGELEHSGREVFSALWRRLVRNRFSRSVTGSPQTGFFAVNGNFFRCFYLAGFSGSLAVLFECRFSGSRCWCGDFSRLSYEIGAQRNESFAPWLAYCYPFPLMLVTMMPINARKPMI